MKKRILIIFTILISFSVNGQKNNLFVGISTSSYLQLHKSCTDFFDFEFNKWKLYYRGSTFELNSNYYFTDKVSILIKAGAGYNFYEESKHYDSGIILLYPVYPQKIDIYFLSFGVGIIYDFYNINDKWKLFAAGDITSFYSINRKYSFDNKIEYDKSFDFLTMTTELAIGINYNVFNKFNIYLKPNIINLRLVRNSKFSYEGALSSFYYPNICFGVNYKFNKNEKTDLY